MIATISVSLLMQLQSQDVIRHEKDSRDKTIGILLRKAQISEDELRLVMPTLLQIAARSQRTPLRWRVTMTIISVVLASVLGAYASDIANFAENQGMEFPEVLPPE